MRKDGKRLRNTDPMYTVVPHIMSERSDSLNAITVRVPYQPLHEYILKKRREGEYYSYLSLITAAYLRTVAEYPYLNRFIMNKKIYARTELNVGMVVLHENENEETMSKVKFSPKDTIADVNRKMAEFIEGNRHSDANSTDGLITALTRSDFLLRVGINLFKFLDRHGLLPRSVIEASPFHASMVISNLASIRTNHIHHHIYNFGTVGVLITIGTLQDVPRRHNGEIILERQIPLGIVMDERLGSGLQYAKAFKLVQKYLREPELLETPPEHVNYDVEWE